MKKNILLDRLLSILNLPYTYIDKGSELYLFLTPENKLTWDLEKNENSSYVISKGGEDQSNSEWVYSTIVCTFNGDRENPPEYDEITSKPYSTKEDAIAFLLEHIEHERISNTIESIHIDYLHQQETMDYINSTRF